MKHIAQLFFFAAVAIFAACSDSTILPDASELDGGSRGIIPGEPSESNPSLLSNWENCSSIYLNEVGNSGHSISVTPPWRNGSNTSLNSNFCYDIKKTDGWIMLFHTFTCSDDNPKLNYMCFYNQFSGYVKVFYYCRDSNYATESKWCVISHNTASDKTPFPSALFCDSEYFSQPIDGDDNFSVWSIIAENETITQNSGLKFGWNGFEFRVGEYNPKIAESNFTIDAYNIIYTTFNFDGTETSTTTGTITTLNAGSSSPLNNPLAKATINYTGEHAKIAVDTIASKFLNKNFAGINFKNIIAKVGTGDYVGAITSGLGSLFKSFIKPKPTVSEVKLQTQGTITLQGSSESETVANIGSLSFAMKNILEGDRTTPKGDFDTYDKVSTATNSKIELGVWNLRKKPTLYYERYTKYSNELGIPEDYNGGAIDFHGMLDYPQTRIGDIEVVFNPAIAKYIKSYSVTTGVIDVVGGNRAVNNKGKLVIDYNRDNRITSANDITTYGVDYLNRDLFMMVDGLSDKEVNNDTQLYIDWGDNVGGNRAAVVSLTMNVDYNGNEFSYTESRVYDVVYVPTTNGLSVAYFNNPPSSYILNQAGNSVYCSNLYY